MTMRRLQAPIIAMALIFGAPTLTACATTTAAFDSTADEKALAAAETAFSAYVADVERKVDAGELKGEDARKATADLDKARALLLAAREAYRLGNAAATIANANKVKELAQ